MTKIQEKEIIFYKRNDEVTMPKRSSPAAAGYDLVAVEAEVKGKQVIVSTRLHVAFDEAYVMLVYGRSGLAFKHDIFLTNGVGVIDADYRGEIKLSFSSTTLTPEEMMNFLAPGNRVAQAILQPIPAVTWVEVDDLPESIRGVGGFGSTGLKSDG